LLGSLNPDAFGSIVIGSSISHYRITAKLGEGGMGVVYRAHDEQLDRDVAIKVLPEEMDQDAERLTRFEHEARAVAKLAHPNILQVHELGRHEGRSFMVTELLEGGTLRERLEGGALGWRQAAEIAAAIADGLAAAHKAGIVHRDLKPSNVFLTADGRVKLLDFGLARSLDVLGKSDSDARTLTRCTAAGSVLGTVGYMSPEQVRGDEADERADIFALGCVLYEMVSGDRAFCLESAVETMNAILNEEPAELSRPDLDLPPELGSTIRRCLEKGPEARFQSASDLAYNLRSVSSASAPVIPRERPPRAVRTRRALWVSLVVVAAALIAAWIWAPWQHAPAPNRIAVAPLENRTGDPSHDNLGVMAAESIIQRFAETGAAETVILSPGPSNEDLLFEQARQKGAALLLSGACFPDGETIRLQARLTNPVSGESVYAFEAETVEEGAAAVGAAALGEKVVAAVAAHLDHNFDITLMRPPCTYEAYQAFQSGEDRFGIDHAAAVLHFQRALELDPRFNYCRLYIGYAYENAGAYEQAKQALLSAEEHLDQFTPYERIEFRYLRASLAGDRVGELNAARQMVKSAPNLLWLRRELAARANESNRPREALEALAHIDPGWYAAYFSSPWWEFTTPAESYHLLGDYERENEAADRGLERFPDIGHLYRHKAAALAGMGRVKSVSEIVADCLRLPIRLYSPGQIMVRAASELRYHGNPEASDALAAQAVEWFESKAAGAGHEDQSPICLWSYACALQAAGRWDESRKLLLELSGTEWHRLDIAGALGVLAARSGDRDEAERISRQLSVTEDPYSPAIRVYWRTCIAAQLGDRDRALALLGEAFAEGLQTRVWVDDLDGDFYWQLHADVNLEPLWHYPPFEELIKPKG